jgi:hypothetical protein
VKNGQGIQTWWANDFGCALPALAHPTILKAVETNENYERQQNK